MDTHRTVLLTEAVDALVGDAEGFYIDGTFGRGGHSQLILQRLGVQGQLLAVDKDAQAINTAQALCGQDARFDIIQGSFAQLYTTLKMREQLGCVNGLLVDLGVSSPQLDQAERGFSFLRDGPLDMRMDERQIQTAERWVNTSEEGEMSRVFKTYGEERFAKRIARAIVAARLAKPITTTLQLAKVVAEANPAWEKNKHPATRVFQAIRIEINNELHDLDNLLNDSLEILAVGGRLVVISFHSLEDHRVKHFIRKQARGDDFPMGLPITDNQLNKRLRPLGKAIKPTAAEVSSNPRARSAVMRIAEKLA